MDAELAVSNDGTNIMGPRSWVPDDGAPNPEGDMGSEDGQQPARRGGLLKIILVLGVVAGLVLIGRQIDLAPILDAVEELGFWGPVALGAIYLVAPTLMVPGALLTLGAGALFGVVTGSITVIISATLGASVAFLVGRYAARGWVQRRFVEGNDRFAAVDAAVGREGFKVVLLTRLSPLFPFNMLNYAYGLTRVALKDYMLASFLGMMPGTVMYVYLGAVAGSVAETASGGQGKTPGEWALLSLGLLATIVVTVYVTRIAKRALSQETHGNDTTAPAPRASA
jgi:uncharacterized membrane protein YdjX (TVP38/TMEM64 family)